MRCKICKNTTKSPSAKSWKDGICNKCNMKNKTNNILTEPDILRVTTHPVQNWLDRFTRKEMDLLDK